MELLHNALNGVNIIPTVLLTISVIYWLSVIVGVVDLDFMDIDIDFDLEGGEEIGPIQSILAFLNLREVPLMLVVSIFSLWFWIFSMILVNYIENKGGLINGVLMIPVFILCILITKIITTPLKKIFRRVNQTATEEIGVHEMQVVKLVSEVRQGKIGQAEIKRDGAEILINVKADDEKEVFNKYEEAYIFRKDENKNIYYIIKIKEWRGNGL